MVGFELLLACLTITGMAQTVFQQVDPGCCYSIGYAAFMEPCCLKNEPKGQSECLSAGEHKVGGRTGWNPTCPSSPKEAGEWLTGLQDNPINCPHTRPAMGEKCSGSQDCKYQVHICPDGEQHYNPHTQCTGKKTWASDAHVCLDGTEHYKVHGLCVNGEWVVSSLRMECQDCLANLQTLGDAGSCALVTKGDAEVAAHNIYTCIVIGGTLIDGSPTEHAAVDGPAYVHQLGQPGRWNFNAGGPFKNASVDTAFERLESLASSPNLQNYTELGDDLSQPYRVFVLTSGGTFHQGMFGGGQPEDNGKTLVVFNTRDPITITSSDLGRQFGPSILAPFSEVTLLGKAGYIDGCVIAKSFKTHGNDAGGLQLHGDCYRGPLCSTKPFPPQPPKHPKWWMWIVGVGAGAAAAAITIPLAIGAAHKPTPTAPPIDPCAIPVQKSAIENSEDYQMGRHFGSTWACAILFAFVFFVVVMSFAVARFRYARDRSARDTRRGTLVLTAHDDDLPVYVDENGLE